MSDYISDLCISSLDDLNKLESQCEVEISILNDLLKKNTSEYPSKIDPIDIALPILYGTLGGFLASSEKLNEYLNKIHDVYAKQDGILGKVLGHEGDNIDMINGSFLNRNGDQAGVLFHRLLRGHDPFSIGHGDNPFSVLMKQHGAFRGIVKVFQHLVCDTFSKQGLPVPFHSYFDFFDDKGNLSNKLITWTKKIADDSGTDIRTTFKNLFTIQASDVISTGLTWTLCSIHIKMRKMEDPVMIAQTKIIGYSAQFFSRSIIMSVKTGVPALSWPTLALLLKEIAAFYIANWKEIHKLEKITKELVKTNNSLENSVFETRKDLPTYNNSAGYIEEFNNADKNINKLIDSFE